MGIKTKHVLWVGVAILVGVIIIGIKVYTSDKPEKEVSETTEE